MQQIYVDREPEIFKNVLDYLRSDRKYLPNDISMDKKKKVEIELKHWNITKLDYSLATCPYHLKIEEIFNSTHTLYEQSPTLALDIWKSLGPLSIQEMISKSNFNP